MLHLIQSYSNRYIAQNALSCLSNYSSSIKKSRCIRLPLEYGSKLSMIDNSGVVSELPWMQFLNTKEKCLCLWWHWSVPSCAVVSCIIHMCVLPWRALYRHRSHGTATKSLSLMVSASRAVPTELEDREEIKRHQGTLIP